MSDEENKDIEEDMENNYDEDDIESRNNNSEEEEPPLDQLPNEIDRMFEQILLNYISQIMPVESNPNTYYYGRNSISNDVFQYSTTIYNSTTNNNGNGNIFDEFEEEYDDDDDDEYNGYLNDSFFHNIVNRIIDPIEGVLNRSLEEQPSLEKNKEEMDIESVKYGTIIDKKEKNCCICLEDFCNEEDVSLINCEHLFHTTCIKEWSTYNITCPVCRKNLEE